jgi:hypothetical protein
MNILLLGEFSGLYKNLSEGLTALGHNVNVVSSGDYWKGIKPDVNLYTLKNNGLVERINYRIQLYNILRNIKDYDIVQLINPDVLFLSYFPYYHVIDTLMKHNNKFYLSAAGDDAYFWKYGRQFLRKGDLFGSILKYDIKSNTSIFDSNKAFEFNQYIADKCNGIIPIMYEYEISYKNHSNRKKTIPIPINTKKIKYSPNVISNKVVIFHGLNRYGAKGTRFVEIAFEKLRKKYPNDLELIIDGKMPLDKYLDIMKRVNVILDQTYSYSCGMNAVYALAMGKVVMGGAEPESLISLGVTESPVINILPDVNDIEKKIEECILEKKRNIENIGYEGRLFAENTHDYIKIAQQYVDTWLKN